MTRTSIATDNFNRADGGLGANWTGLNTATGNIQILTNVIGGTVAGPGTDGVSSWAGSGSFTADQYSSLVIGNFTGNTGAGGYGIGVIARASADTDSARDYYFIRITTSTVLGKVVNGSETTLNSGSISWAPGDRCEIECEGTTIRLCQNGTAAGGAWTVTDSAIATGLPGVLGMGYPTIASGDSWEGGNLGSVATRPNPQRRLLIGVG